MANEKTIIDQWSVRDLEDGSSLTVTVVITKAYDLPYEM